VAQLAPDHPDADRQAIVRNVRQPIRGSLLILRPTKRRIRIVRIAGVAIVVDTIEATEAEASKPAPMGAVAVAKGVGVRLEATFVEATSVEAASSESGALVDAASSESAASVDAASCESAASVETAAASESAASAEGAATSESATSVAAAATAGISAHRGERQGAKHEKSRKGSLDRWTHESLSLMYSIDY
jgi:hypothetical protein